MRPCETTRRICGWAHERPAGEAPGAAARPTSRQAKSASRRKRLTPDSSSGRPKIFSVRIVELEITPEPSPEERAAIAGALESRGGESAGPYRSVWRLAALLENVESAGDAPRFASDTGSPRNSRGANRA